MKLLILAGNTARSRAYAHVLRDIPNVEVIGLLYGFEDKPLSIPTLNNETNDFLVGANIDVPDLNEPLPETFAKNEWSFELVATREANASELISRIVDCSPDIVVFSGYGGQILSQEHFDLGIPYLHMHPGSLPEERGSTTIYYSILLQRKCTVTAFLMTAEIDSGVIVSKKEYPIPLKGVNVDVWYDNCIRANCLKGALSEYRKNSSSLTRWPNNKKSEEYYVIHPVLKNIALLSLD
jgi:methionyl-tRNA formyltransferase